MKKLFYSMVVIAVLGLIVSGCSIPLKSVVPTSEKGNLNPELGAPTLEKITFIHYAKPNDRSQPEWDEEVDMYKLLLGGLKWTKTMTYEVNPYESGLEEVYVVINTLKASLETWDTETSFELFNDRLKKTKQGFNSGDFINRVTWGELSPGIIAVNYIWYNPATKEILESDIEFNNYYTWSTSGGNDAMDLQNIATHEFGHNGLNDLYMPPSQALTMYGYSDFGETDKRDLGTGDISGIQELYGE
jgi:hypothetical protein